MVDPSVLTMSGSSMPGSWLLVVEKGVPLTVVPAFPTGAAAVWGLAMPDGDAGRVGVDDEPAQPVMGAARVG